MKIGFEDMNSASPNKTCKSNSMSHTPEQIFQIAQGLHCYRDWLAGIRAFNEAPIMDKAQLYTLVAECMSDPEFRKGLYLSPTGGSTSSEPLYFPADIAENHFQRAALASYLSKTGILTKDSIVLNLFGSTFMYRSAEIINEFCELVGATVLPASAHASDAGAYKIAQQFGANCIAGTSSRIIQFAKYFQENKPEHRFEQVIFGGEPLPAYKEQFLKDVLNIGSFNGIFGSAEAGVFGFKLQQGAVAKYLCPADLVHIELIDPDEEGFGTMILTNLIRTRFPLLRYNTGDIVRLSKEKFQGAEFNVIEFRGRTDRSFQIGGEYILLSQFSKLFEGLLDFQITLSYDASSKMDQIDFRLVPKEQPDEHSRELIVTGIQRTISNNPKLFRTSIEFVEMDQLKKTPHSQKVIKIIDERP